MQHVEVTEQELLEYLATNRLTTFDGMRYTVPVEMLGGTWNKPIAYTVNGRHYKLVEV